MSQSDINLNLPENWKYSSPIKNGLHTVISPENSACRLTSIFRLNLSAGQEFEYEQDTLESNAALIYGNTAVTHKGHTFEMAACDSFYIPAGESIAIRSHSDSSFYVGAAPYEGKGEFFMRKFDPAMPPGEIMQIHGEPPYQRHVFMTINQEVPGSRLICGITWGEPGKWTSWPPHQHSQDLEEVYCYFDIPAPQRAFHFASRKPGEFEFIHPVSTGDCVVIPEGYHPTCGMPGVSSKYFWVMAAFSQKSRRYDLAVNDPHFA